MSRQGRRPTVGGGSSEVVSIGVGGSHRPDYPGIACGQVAAARRELGMDIPAFTRLINELTDWDAMPETVARWERDRIPPTDVWLAVTDTARLSPGTGLTAPLLAGVPPAFPPGHLAGHWLTAYQFSHGEAIHHHADIAHVTVGTDGRVRAVNHPPEPRSEGRERPFRNVIDAVLAGRHLTGQWQNTSDTRYHGSLNLAVLPGEVVMRGGYMGVASDIDVSTGTWRWVRLDLAATDSELAVATLRDPTELHDLVMAHNQYGEPLTLADVTEER